MERKQQLEQELVELYSEKFSDDQVQDIGDQALSSTMEALRSSLQDKEIEEYNMIRQVIDRIDSGEYGICVDCGQPISEKRLSVYLNATRCLACQEALEG
ncbi:TraR/DksA family transcriptional regulator [Candidatus Babeliales bacterium]|nr:TraR/DksA family transcriptional regulator [Candidatus Babeliales bacterium]